MEEIPETQIPAVLATDHLIFQQTRNFMGNDFTIQDAQGNPLAHLETTGGTLSRFTLGTRYFTLIDHSGQELFSLEDTFDILGDYFEITYPNGSPLATVRKRFTVFSQHMEIQLPDLTLDLRGSILDYDFQIYAGDHVAATIAREWAGIGKALLGHSRYGVQFDPQAPPTVRLAIIGALVALDLVRQKRKS